jgi:hypothetical protein
MNRKDFEMEAAKIIDSPLFDEAFNQVREHVVDLMAAHDPTDLAGLQALQIELRVVAKVKSAFEYYLQMGKIAQHNKEQSERVQ